MIGGRLQEVRVLRQKLGLSYGVLRKLYRRNVDLERELQLSGEELAALRRQAVRCADGISRRKGSVRPRIGSR